MDERRRDLRLAASWPSQVWTDGAFSSAVPWT
jgi:hypothetical protein